MLSASLLAAPRARAHDDYLLELQGQAIKQGLHRDRMWRVLLHYRKTMHGRWRSEADGLAFFNAGAAGKIDPAQELLATLAAFRTAPVDDAAAMTEEGQHPQCRFPARWTWLKERLGIDPEKFSDQPCPLFERWRQAISPESVTLVYAAAYLNSPASMYGHTFLRLSRSTGDGNPLIDYIINFAADVDTDNGLVYAVKGVLGGFYGRFYLMPFYMKIQEYSNMESRDLWEYELTLTAEESSRLLEHTWETRSTLFEYYFFSENCSYFLLALLEAARPSLRLSEAFTGSVIPANTVRAILDIPGLVTQRRPRPALLAQLRQRKNALTPREQDVADAVAKTGAPDDQAAFAKMPPRRQALVLETAEALLRFRTDAPDQLGEAYKERERKILILRGRTGVPHQKRTPPPEIAPPEEGHNTGRIGWEVGTTDGAPGRALFTELSLRGAIHDFLDPQGGFPPNTVLEMGHLRLRFEPESRRAYVSGFDAVNIVSAVPIERWLTQPSWRVWAGAGRSHARDQAGPGSSNGWDGLYGGVSAGTGPVFGAGKWGVLYALFESDLGAGPAFDPGYRVGFGAHGGGVLHLTRWWHVHAAARYVYYFVGDTRRVPVYTAAQSVSLGRHLQLRVRGLAEGAYREASVGLYGYF